MKNPFVRIADAGAVLLFASLATAFAHTNQPASLSTTTQSWKPSWLTEVSLGFREGFDNNVYRSGCDEKYYPGAYRSPIPGSVTALPNQGSFFDIFTPRVAVDLAKLLGDDSILQTMAFSYAPDFVNYYDAASESYVAHRLASTIVAKYDDLTFQLDEGFTIIDGSKYGPTYPGKYYSTPGQGVLRERRDQDQDRTTATLTYDQPTWFFRPVVSVLDDNLKTAQTNVAVAAHAGYLNYVDRADYNVGADVGYKVATNFALTLGYRVGYQYQEKEPHSVDALGQSAASQYQRMLFGFEGRPVSWLKVKVQAGPDFRDYNANAPVRDRNPVVFYGDGSLTADLSKDDSISASAKRWRYASSTGMLPYDAYGFDLTYKHQFNKQWSAKLGCNAQSVDYSCGEVWSGGTSQSCHGAHVLQERLAIYVLGRRAVLGQRQS